MTNQEAGLTLGAFRTTRRSQPGIETQASAGTIGHASGASSSGSPVSQEATKLGTHRSPVIPRVLERKGRDGPT